MQQMDDGPHPSIGWPEVIRRPHDPNYKVNPNFPVLPFYHPPRGDPYLPSDGVRGGQVSLNAWTMTSCGLMLESLLAAASNFTNSDEQAHFIGACYEFARCVCA